MVCNNNNNQYLLNNNSAGEGVEFHFTFSFIYEFENEYDEVWFAHAIPYTYKNLQENLIKIRENPEYEDHTRVRMMSQSLGGNVCPLLTITENINTYLDYYDEAKMNLCLPHGLKRGLKQKYMKARKLAKQASESHGKVKKLLMAAADEEIISFYALNEDLLKHHKMDKVR